jgi:hypothetical protein
MTTSQYVTGHDRCSQNEALLRRNRVIWTRNCQVPGVLSLRSTLQNASPLKKPPLMYHGANADHPGITLR